MHTRMQTPNANITFVLVVHECKPIYVQIQKQTLVLLRAMLAASEELPVLDASGERFDKLPTHFLALEE